MPPMPPRPGIPPIPGIPGMPPPPPICWAIFRMLFIWASPPIPGILPKRPMFLPNMPIIWRIPPNILRRSFTSLVERPEPFATRRTRLSLNTLGSVRSLLVMESIMARKRSSCRSSTLISFGIPGSGILARISFSGPIFWIMAIWS